MSLKSFVMLYVNIKGSHHLEILSNAIKEQQIKVQISLKSYVMLCVNSKGSDQLEILRYA